MSKVKFLLAISSTEQSLDAAELTWALAKRSRASVTALHVVNSAGAWQLLNFERPGFMGSGVHIEAHKAIKSVLESVGRSLLEVYTARSASQNGSSDTLLHEGDPVEEICKRAVEYDLVIIGHRPSHIRQPEERNLRDFSVAERLAHSCPVPLLVVQDKCAPWKHANIFSSVDHVNKKFLSQCLATCRQLDMSPEITFLYSDIQEQAPDHFLKDWKESVIELEDVPMGTRQLDETVIKDGLYAWLSDERELDSYLVTPGLVILPTHVTGSGRETIFGSLPDLFIRQSSHPAILLWPEEYSPRVTQTSAVTETVSGA